MFYVAVTRARERLILLYQEKDKEDPEIYVPTTMNSFRSFVHFLHLEDKYGVITNYEGQSFTVVYNYNDDAVELKNINVKPEIVNKKRASKERSDEVSSDLLEFGNEIHYLLEITNFDSKDTSFIADVRMRRYVDNVLRAKVFGNIKNSQVLHEYSFFDEKNGVSGIIDCLVVKDGSIDIVDFKLKNLDDEKYVLQLHTYRDYIEQISDKPIRMYLISAITGEVKEVE